MSLWISFWDRYSWGMVRDKIRSLQDTLGFEKRDKPKFFGLVLDLETVVYDNVLERYLTYKEAVGVYFILNTLKQRSMLRKAGNTYRYRK